MSALHEDPDRPPSFTVRVGTDIDTDALVALYASVGWAAYSRAPVTLVQAIRQSLRVVTAWEGAQLVGLARVVGDGVTIVFLQDVLVVPHRQRDGVGRALMESVFAPYGDVRQHVLLTDDEPRQRAFYESLGFTEAHDFRPGELRSFVRFAS